MLLAIYYLMKKSQLMLTFNLCFIFALSNHLIKSPFLEANNVSSQPPIQLLPINTFGQVLNPDKSCNS